MNWPDSLQGIYYSLLPQGLWGKWKPYSTVTFVRAAMVSAVVETLVCVTFLFRGAVFFLVARSHQLRPLREANEGTQLYFGGIFLIEYLLRPLSLLLLYGVGEGIVRWLSVWLMEEVLPILPLKIAWLIREQYRRRQEERRRGPIIPDVLERLDGKEYEISIRSCRAKEGWRESVTVVIDGNLYELAKVNSKEAPYRFEYMFRKHPLDKIIRGIYRYDPR